MSINNRKNKLNNKIILIFILIQTHASLNCQTDLFDGIDTINDIGIVKFPERELKKQKDWVVDFQG